MKLALKSAHFLRRTIRWTFAILAVLEVITLVGGYGLRLSEKPCAHLTGFGVVVTYFRTACPEFKWHTPPL